MHCCKHCESAEVVKNGHVRGQQRYQCQICGLNFVPGAKRVKVDTAIKRAFAVMLSSLGKAFYGLIAKLCGVTPPAVQKWLKREAAWLGAPAMPATIKAMEFDEMWHVLGSKHTTSGSSRRWIVLHGDLWPEWSAVVMLQPASDSTTRSST
jgi:transposase-like protein